MLFRPLLHLNSSRALTTGLICLSGLSSISRTTLAPFSSSCSVAMSQPVTPEWLQEQLSTLLASPYIHFNQPKLPGGLHLRMGPGPIDLFSTRFANMFTKEATGVVAGVQVDKEGLKQSLLALQKQWSADTARFVATEPQSAEFQVSISRELHRNLMSITTYVRLPPNSPGPQSRQRRTPQ